MSIEKIKIAENQYVWVDKNIQPVKGYYYDTFIGKIRNTSNAEYAESKITLQIIAATSNLNIKVPTWEEYLAEKEFEKAPEFMSAIRKISFIKGYQKRDEECKEEMKNNYNINNFYCKARSEYSDCEIHKSNIDGCFGCGNFIKKD